jgi:biotin carboxyl carrier protein
MKLTIEINGKEYNVQIGESAQEKDAYSVVVDGAALRVKVKGEPAASLPASAPQPRPGPAVKAEAPARPGPPRPDITKAAMVEPPKAEAAVGANAIPAPMPGTIVAVSVAAGESVKKGKEVVTMETMKMNVPIFAPSDGKIKSVLVKPGESVKAGQPLIEYA